MNLIWIKYSTDEIALINKDTNDFYVFIIKLKRSKKSPGWAVRGVGRFKKICIDLEGIYNYEQQFAKNAPIEIIKRGIHSNDIVIHNDMDIGD